MIAVMKPHKPRKRLVSSESAQPQDLNLRSGFCSESETLLTQMKKKMKGRKNTASKRSKDRQILLMGERERERKTKRV